MLKLIALLCLAVIATVYVEAIEEFQDQIPGGPKFRDLKPEFQKFNFPKGRVVANNEKGHVLVPVQTKEVKEDYDPFKIGEYLSYLYEKSNFGEQGPPMGFSKDFDFGTAGQDAGQQRVKRFLEKDGLVMGKMVFEKKKINKK